MFSAIAIDDSDDEEQKIVKKTTEKKAGAAAEKKAPVVQKPVPGAAPKVIPGMPKPKQAAIAAVVVVAPEPAASDPTTEKVNDRGGKAREKHGSGRGGKQAPGEARAHPRRHEYDITGRGGGKEGSRGGRGPGGWGSHQEEAHRAEKNPEDVVTAEETAPADESTPETDKEVVPEAPAVFGLDEYLARRTTNLRANEELFGAVKERTVQADASLKVLKKDDVEASDNDAKGGKKQQRSSTKTSLDASFTVAPAVTFVPREPRESGRGEGRGAGRGGRGEGRGAGRGGRGREAAGRGRGSATKLHAEDFPAL